MKWYVKCNTSSIKSLANDHQFIRETVWTKLIDKIESLTQFKVDSVDRENPDSWITLYDDKGTEYQAEITKYSDGEYELNTSNIHTVD